MKVHLHIELQEICPIEWANAQESITTDFRQTGSFFAQSHPVRTMRNMAVTNMRRLISSPGRKPLGSGFLGFTHCCHEKWRAVSRKLACLPQPFLHGSHYSRFIVED